MPYVSDGDESGPAPLHETYRHQRWVVWSIAALFYGYQFSLRVSPSVMTNHLMTDFAIDAATVGSVSSFYYVSYATLQIPVGIAMDKYGPRKMLFMASLFASFGALVFGSAGNIIFLAVARVMIGAGASCGFLSCVKLASLWFPADKLPIVIGISTAVGTMGATSAGGPLAACIHYFGWRHTMHTVGMLGFTVTACVLLVVRDGYGSTATAPIAYTKLNRSPTTAAAAADSVASATDEMSGDDASEHHSLMDADSRMSREVGAGSSSAGTGFRSPMKQPHHNTNNTNGVAVTVYESVSLISPLAMMSAPAAVDANRSVELLPLSTGGGTASATSTDGTRAMAVGGDSSDTHASLLDHSTSPTDHSTLSHTPNGTSINTGSGSGDNAAGLSPFALLSAIFSNRQTWIFGAFGLFAYLPISVLADMWATRFVAHAWQTDTASAAMTVSCLYIGVGCGAPCFAYFSTQMASHRKPMTLGVAGALFWCCVLLYGPYVSFGRLSVIFFAMGFCVSGQSLAFSAVVQLNARHATGTATGIQNMGCMISGMVFQPIAGLLLDYKHQQLQAAAALDSVTRHTAHFTFALSSVPCTSHDATPQAFAPLLI